MIEKYIVLDFEMNPVNKTTSNTQKSLKWEIIEIGAVMLNKDLRKQDTFACLIKPKYNNKISDEIVKLTGITTDDIKNAISFSEAIEKFHEWIGNDENTIYCWSDNDICQFFKECKYKKITVPDNMKNWVDFQKAYQEICRYKQKSNRISLRDAVNRESIGYDIKEAHRALYDAKKTANLLSKVLKGNYKLAPKKSRRRKRKAN